MLKKTYSKTGTSCRVTFKLPSEIEADAGAVLGDWNEWSAEANPLTRRRDGSLSVTLSLDAGREYRFRYLLDGTRWENDQEADRLVPNRFGGQDGIVSV